MFNIEFTHVLPFRAYGVFNVRGLGWTPCCHPFSRAHPRCLTGNDVIQAAIADVVSPAVTTHNPEAAASEHVFPGSKLVRTGSPKNRMEEILHHQKDGWNPINPINHLSTGAGFLPSTVICFWKLSQWCFSLAVKFRIQHWLKMAGNFTSDSSGMQWCHYALISACSKGRFLCWTWDKEQFIEILDLGMRILLLTSRIWPV